MQARVASLLAHTTRVNIEATHARFYSSHRHTIRAVNSLSLSASSSSLSALSPSSPALCLHCSSSARSFTSHARPASSSSSSFLLAPHNYQKKDRAPRYQSEAGGNNSSLKANERPFHRDGPRRDENNKPARAKDGARSSNRGSKNKHDKDKRVQKKKDHHPSAVKQLAKKDASALAATDRGDGHSSEAELDISATLSQLLTLSDPGSTSAVAKAMGGASYRPVKPTMVPAEVQLSVHDDLIRAFDPTISQAEADAMINSAAAQTPSMMEAYLKDKEIVVEKDKDSFSLGDSRFAASDKSGVLDPDIVHDLSMPLSASTGSELKMETARAKGLQLSLTDLLLVAGKYQSVALQRNDRLQSSLSSPLSRNRSLPRMSSRDPTSSSLKSKQLREMEAVFEVIEARGYPRTIHHTAMIIALGREGFVADAENRFQQMLQNKDDPIAYKMGSFFPDTVTCNAMVEMYQSTLTRFTLTAEEKKQYLEKARNIFRTMGQHSIKKDIVTYTSMIHILSNEIARNVDRSYRGALLKEALELFQFMQTEKGGEIKPAKRSFSILAQSLATHGDGEGSMVLLQNMMRNYEVYPNMAMMNGLLKATAFGCTRELPPYDPKAEGAQPKPMTALEPVTKLAALMRQLKLEPNEHSVLSVMRGLALNGHVALAKELHEHLDDGSLGTARPTRKTTIGLMSLMINDHNQSFGDCVQIYEKALQRDAALVAANTNALGKPIKKRQEIAAEKIFTTAVTRRNGTVLDLRHLGYHPELYSIAITRQLNQFLQKWMELTEPLYKRDAEFAAKRQNQSQLPETTDSSSPASSSSDASASKAAYYLSKNEDELLSQVVPSRGWLVLTGRHRGDVSEAETGIQHAGYEFDAYDELSYEDPALASLKDEFPDDADYSEWDDSGVLKGQKAQEVAVAAASAAAKKGKSKQFKGPSPREQSRLNRLHTWDSESNYGQVVSNFLRAQTPSLNAVANFQFEKTTSPDERKQKRLEQLEKEREYRRRRGGLDSAVPLGQAAESDMKNKEAEEQGEEFEESVPTFLDDEEHYDDLRRSSKKNKKTAAAAAELSDVADAAPAVVEDVPSSRSFPLGAAKTEELNNGMMIVRRPEMKFWLKCHAYVLRYHQQHGTGSSQPQASTSIPPPDFLEKKQQGKWWSKLVESIEIQHGLASLQSSGDYLATREREQAEAAQDKEQRMLAGYRGTDGKGRRIDPEEKVASFERERTAKERTRGIT